MAILRENCSCKYCCHDFGEQMQTMDPNRDNKLVYHCFWAAQVESSCGCSMPSVQHGCGHC